MKRYGILGEDGSSNGRSYATREEAQRQIDEMKRDFPKIWNMKLMVVDFWVLECVLFCNSNFPSHVARWKKFEFSGDD